MLYKSTMTWEQASRTFYVSKSSVGQTLKEGLTKKNSTNSEVVKTKKKGAKITNNQCYFNIHA